VGAQKSIDLLVKYGADPFIQDDEGRTPQEVADLLKTNVTVTIQISVETKIPKTLFAIPLNHFQEMKKTETLKIEKIQKIEKFSVLEFFIPFEEIKILKLIGQGGFGSVHEGLWFLYYP
jgi:hypothetical protein